jgi:arylsulfatase A-like enzyme
MLAGPGVPAGARAPALCYLHDLVATVGDLVAVPPPAESECTSLLPVLRGEVPAVRQALLLSYRHLQRALVTPEWKLIEYPATGRTQLFDLAHDPDELMDQAAEPSAHGRRREFEAQLEAMQRAAGDPLLEASRKVQPKKAG